MATFFSNRRSVLTKHLAQSVSSDEKQDSTGISRSSGIKICFVNSATKPSWDPISNSAANPPETFRASTVIQPSSSSVRLVASNSGGQNVKPRGNPTSSLDGCPVCIVVGRGDETKQFWIHVSLLCASSKYFAAMFTGSWAECKTGSVTLDDIDPKLFEAYQAFLYFGKVKSDFGMVKDGQHNVEYERLVLCYSLGDRLAAADFMDATIDRIIANSYTSINGSWIFPNGHVTTLAYKYLPAGSPLRALFVNQHVVHGKTNWISVAEKDAYDPQFLYDLTLALLSHRVQPGKGVATVPTSASCVLHQHVADGKTCYKQALLDQ